MPAYFNLHLEGVINISVVKASPVISAVLESSAKNININKICRICRKKKAFIGESQSVKCEKLAEFLKTHYGIDIETDKTLLTKPYCVL